MALYPNTSTKQIINTEIKKKINTLDSKIENVNDIAEQAQSTANNALNSVSDLSTVVDGKQTQIDAINETLDTVQSTLSEKQDTLTFDNEPLLNSDNPVKSSGIYAELEKKLDKDSVKFNPEPNGTDALSTGGAYDIVQDISERIDNIQNQGALLSNDNVDISNNGCLKIDNQQEVETDAIEVLNGDTKLKDTEINGNLSVSGNIDGNVATHSANGLMSSEDKVRLDAIDSSLEDKTVSDTLTDSSSIIPSGKAVSDVIGSLDASSVGGSGKYISEISETNGVITATSEDIDTAVTSGSSNPVTSGAVASAISNVTPINYIGANNTHPVTSAVLYKQKFWYDDGTNLSASGWYKIATFGKRNRGCAIQLKLTSSYTNTASGSHNIKLNYGWEIANCLDFALDTESIFSKIKLCYNENNNDTMALYVYYDKNVINTCVHTIDITSPTSDKNVTIFDFVTDPTVYDNEIEYNLGTNGLYVNGVKIN